MTPTKVLDAVLFLAFPVASQTMPNEHAQCKFSDGSTITVTYSYQSKRFQLRTDGSLITVKEVNVPAGDYNVVPAKDANNNWTLTMRKPIIEKGSLVLPALPMSIATSVFPVAHFPVFFDQTGGSCMMYLRQKKSDALLSLEFTQKNADQKLRRLAQPSRPVR